MQMMQVVLPSSAAGSSPPAPILRKTGTKPRGSQARHGHSMTVNPANQGNCRRLYWSFTCIFQVFLKPGTSPGSKDWCFVTMVTPARCFATVSSILPWGGTEKDVILNFQLCLACVLLSQAVLKNFFIRIRQNKIPPPSSAWPSNL